MAGTSEYVVDGNSLEELVVAGDTTLDTRNWEGITDLRGNNDGLNASASYAKPGCTYLDWSTGKLYVMDESGQWQEV